MFLKLCCRGGGATSGKSSTADNGGGGHRDSPHEMGTKVGPVRRRWFMLALFAAISMVNAAHWIMYTIITDVVEQHYGVSTLFVSWTAVVYMVAYITLVLPASWLIDKHGLRVALILCSVLMTTGAWIKVYAVGPTQFPIAFAGQALIGIAQMFSLGAPGRLAALWFGANQVSLACALGVFGNQLGVAIGFLLPPLLVQLGDDTTTQLRVLCEVYAVVPTAILVLVIIFFNDAPPRPPSPAQARAVAEAEAEAEAGGDSYKSLSSFIRSIKTLLTMPNFLLLLASYGLTAGSFFSLSTILNPLVLSIFPGANKHVGSLGLTMVLVGVVGSAASGAVLDTWHRYKETTIGAMLLGGVGMAAFMTALYFCNLTALYMAGAFLGFFTAGFIPVGYEFSAELTYPMPEATVVGLLNAAGELMGIILSQGGVALQGAFGSLATMGTVLVLVAVSLLLCCFIPNDLKRLAATATATATGAGEPTA